MGEYILYGWLLNERNRLDPNIRAVMHSFTSGKMALAFVKEIALVCMVTYGLEFLSDCAQDSVTYVNIHEDTPLHKQQVWLRKNKNNCRCCTNGQV